MRYAAVAAAVAGVLAALAIWFFRAPRGAGASGGAPDYAALPPMAPADSSIAVGYRKTPSPYLQPFVDSLKQMLGASGPADDAEKRERVLRFLEESGLSAADVRWFVASTGPVKASTGGGLADVPEFRMASSFSHDPGKIAAAYNGARLETAPTVEPAGETAGFKTWRACLEPAGGNPAEGFSQFYYASLGGEILLSATSREELARLIALYAGEEPEQPAFASALSGGDACTFFIPRFGETAAVFMDEIFPVSRLDAYVADGSKKFLSLGEFTLTLAPRERGGFNIRIALNAADEKDANEIRAMLVLGLMKARVDVRSAAKRPGQAPERAELLAHLAESLKGTSVKADGATLVAVIPVSDAAARKIVQDNAAGIVSRPGRGIPRGRSNR
jgi:hypothetical protein